MLTQLFNLPNGAEIEFFASDDCDLEELPFFPLPEFPALSSLWGNSAKKSAKRTEAKKARKAQKLARRKNR